MSATEAEAFDPARVRGKPAGVLGLGRSGLHVANLLASKGLRVLVSDTRPRHELLATARKLRPGVRWEGGGHSERLLRCAFVVKSPGIPSRAPVLESLRRARVPVFSEIEVSLAYCRSREVLAVTGTNGKTTTTLLTAAIFQAARRRVHVAGNIGLPLARQIPRIRPEDVLVLELSSYQLEDSRSLRPAAAALLNLTADHVDHHGGMRAYIAAKARIFRRQASGDACVFNARDPLLVQMSRRCRSRRLFFGLEPSSGTHAWVERGEIRVRLPDWKKALRLKPPRLPGSHNIENAMAAALLALDRGLPERAVQRAFASFTGAEHRLEECAGARGIRCVNDSKATNVESTLTALRALCGGPPSILLILGGLHKGYPYTPLRPFLGVCVKGILSIGGAAGKIEEDLGGLVPIFPCGDLDTAVRTGLQIAAKGDTLLLSPACASFDQFRDFEHRGKRFKEIVRLCGLKR